MKSKFLIYYLCTISTLRKLQAEGLDMLPQYRIQSYGQPQVSPVTDFRCVKCKNSITGTSLLPFLQSIKTLKRFVFEISSRSDGYRVAPDWSFKVGMEWAYEVGLLPHKDWLEELVIAQSDDAAAPNAWKLGKLNDFTNLRRLAIPEAALEIQGQRPDSSLHRLLRPSLEELQIEFFKSSFDGGKFPKGKPMTLRMLAEDGTWVYLAATYGANAGGTQGRVSAITEESDLVASGQC